MAFLHRLLSFSAIFAELQRTAMRFPLPLACALAFCLVTIFDFRPYAYLVFAGDDPELRLRILLFLGFFATLAAALFAERLKMALLQSIPLALVLFALLAARVYTLPALDDVWFEGYVLFLGPAMILLAMTAPFLLDPRAVDGFWNFNRTAWLGAAAAFLAALILAIGLTSAVYAIDTLFGIKIGDDLLEVIWVASLSVIWPLLALATIPEGIEESAEATCPQLLARLIGYLLVPLTLFYLVILYAYGAKILIDWALPDGQVASLVAIYATFGAAVHLVAYPLRESGPLPVRLFCRWFYPALLLPVVLLALAVWFRIEAYGVTEQRYMLAVFALWLAVMTLWFWRKPDQGLMFVPLSLALFLTAACFGPWGAVSLSTTSQLARLQVLLTKHELLREGRIVRSEGTLDWDEQKAISSIVDYLWKSGKREALTPWFAAGGLELEKIDFSTGVMTAMGLTYVGPWQTQPSFRFNVQHRDQFAVDGFETLVNWPIRYRGDWKTTVETEQGTYEIALDKEMTSLKVTDGAGRVVSFDLLALVNDLGELPKGRDMAEAMTLDQTLHGLRVRLHVNHLSGDLKADTPDVNSFGALILLGRARG